MTSLSVRLPLRPPCPCRLAHGACAGAASALPPRRFREGSIRAEAMARLHGGARGGGSAAHQKHPWSRSEEHTSELQSLMRISYAVFCLKKKKTNTRNTHTHYNPVHTVTSQNIRK